MPSSKNLFDFSLPYKGEGAVDGSDQRSQQAAAFELVRRDLAHGRRGARAGVLAGRSVGPGVDNADTTGDASTTTDAAAAAATAAAAAGRHQLRLSVDADRRRSTAGGHRVRHKPGVDHLPWRLPVAEHQRRFFFKTVPWSFWSSWWTPLAGAFEKKNEPIHSPLYQKDEKISSFCLPTPTTRLAQIYWSLRGDSNDVRQVRQKSMCNFICFTWWNLQNFPFFRNKSLVFILLLTAAK